LHEKGFFIYNDGITYPGSDVCDVVYKSDKIWDNFMVFKKKDKQEKS